VTCDGCQLAMSIDDPARTTPDGRTLCGDCYDFEYGVTTSEAIRLAPDTAGQE
jgi:hypothetical protein